MESTPYSLTVSFSSETPSAHAAADVTRYVLQQGPENRWWVRTLYDKGLRKERAFEGNCLAALAYLYDLLSRQEPTAPLLLVHTLGKYKKSYQLHNAFRNPKTPWKKQLREILGKAIKKPSLVWADAFLAQMDSDEAFRLLQACFYPPYAPE